ncbi:hypothetical protein PR202_gb25971 [Eleusine coracana subsp. coracana]|uniref:Secreted protein n=1 Tax=Eleusine coracana subsp. coracana TaxID=191504 RepID=A0AAV5FRI9_ELECO|nr:hypothetical protein PR202_gb25971 [Eleusine coracana subsp. coracana]
MILSLMVGGAGQIVWWTVRSRMASTLSLFWVLGCCGVTEITACSMEVHQVFLLPYLLQKMKHGSGVWLEPRVSPYWPALSLCRCYLFRSCCVF